MERHGENRQKILADKEQRLQFDFLGAIGQRVTQRHPNFIRDFKTAGTEVREFHVLNWPIQMPERLA